MWRAGDDLTSAAVPWLCFALGSFFSFFQNGMLLFLPFFLTEVVVVSILNTSFSPEARKDEGVLLVG